MDNAGLIGLSRQIALQRELDVIANNVANINTNGFKADSSIFQEFLMPVARADQFRGADNRLSYVRDRATWQDFAQGPLQQTGNPLDVAIDGDAFLAVQTARGERYTRSGSLQISAGGQIVTMEGDAIVGATGPIQIQTGDHDIDISADGTVSVRNGSNTTTSQIRGKMRIVSFAQPQQLMKDGSSLYAAPAAAQQTNPSPRVRLMQGAIEKSNVHSVVEMTRMIEVSRTYAAVASLLQSQGDMRKAAIQQLADVPA
jgi:flagellar basal-body rod protein FlgF/flagellar basal-body rod protein FlgG